MFTNDSITKARPAKPGLDFPRSLVESGRWRRKIRGKPPFFTSWREMPSDAGSERVGHFSIPGDLSPLPDLVLVEYRTESWLGRHVSQPFSGRSTHQPSRHCIAHGLHEGGRRFTELGAGGHLENNVQHPQHQQ